MSIFKKLTAAKEVSKETSEEVSREVGHKKASFIPRETRKMKTNIDTEKLEKYIFSDLSEDMYSLIFLGVLSPRLDEVLGEALEAAEELIPDKKNEYLEPAVFFIGTEDNLIYRTEVGALKKNAGFIRRVYFKDPDGEANQDIRVAEKVSRVILEADSKKREK